MVETKDVVIAIFGATTASNALVLVFIGIVAGTLWSTPNLSSRWRHRFKVGAGVSSFAFLSGLVCTGLSTWWLALHQPGNVYIALVAAFLLQLVLLSIAAAQVLYQAVFR